MRAPLPVDRDTQFGVRHRSGFELCPSYIQSVTLFYDAILVLNFWKQIGLQKFSKIN